MVVTDIVKVVLASLHFTAQLYCSVQNIYFYFMKKLNYRAATFVARIKFLRSVGSPEPCMSAVNSSCQLLSIPVIICQLLSTPFNICEPLVTLVLQIYESNGPVGLAI